MATQDDDDLRLIRASASLLEDLEISLPRILWKPGHRSRVHQLVRLRDLDYIIQLIEPFQPEPHLLDSRLKLLLPPLVDAYLAYLQLASPKSPTSATTSLDVALSKLIYTFCKVRGDKVITGFLNNEPRFLELVLSTLEKCHHANATDAPWDMSYVLLLWVRHLLLAPFDLASISSPGTPSAALSSLDLSPHVPALACRVMAMGIQYITSATKEQDAAAKLLLRLAIRPDMQKLRLPSALVSWALQHFSSAPLTPATNLHSFLGPLRFLVAMTVTPDSEETAALVPRIYNTAKSLLDDPMFAFLTSSAVTKKLIIKLLRNVALLSLQTTSHSLSAWFEMNSVLEDTIDHLLQSLGDRDTPVRFAASKALSMIILRLDSEFAFEVVQAVLEIMKEDMPSSFAETDFQTVDPLRWHGLTLTLAHALFRRSAAPSQLPDIINALLLALNFEQRSTTGNSIGGNVRDAACFGLWSLSRRYTTTELLLVDASAIRTEDGTAEKGSTVVQLVAVHLLLSACLDPVGNIRRGSSAALQELIGRHPDQVRCGIPLVQIVDYHAVGLRARAMIDVAHSASCLDQLYRKALLMALLRWRGTGSPDPISREAAATSIGRLCSGQPFPFFEPALKSLRHQVEAPGWDVEYCHGSLLALSCIIDAKMVEAQSSNAINGASQSHHLSHLGPIWRMFDSPHQIYTQYTTRSLQAQLPSAIAKAITSLSNLSTRVDIDHATGSSVHDNVSAVVAALVAKSDENVTNALPEMVQALLKLHTSGKIASSVLDVGSYVSKLRNDASATTMHGAGRAFALAAAFPWLGDIYEIQAATVCDTLGEIVRTASIVEWRIVALQAARLIIDMGEPQSEVVNSLVEAIHTGLNDYTITERGDVGSLVRIEAINCVCSLWRLESISNNQSADLLLSEDILRLSLERLDRTRLLAARCLRSKDQRREQKLLNDVSSFTYFRESLSALKSPNTPAWEREAILRGCISCAGGGAEALLQAIRAAFVELIHESGPDARLAIMSTLTSILKRTIADGSDPQSLLELLAFILLAVPSLGGMEGFNWRNLLALVQKSHFKSNHIPKILAAVNVYHGLADKPGIRTEVLKKLAGMLRTNPYPTVRVAVVERLYLLVGDDSLKSKDWSKPGQRYEGLVSSHNPA